MMLLPHHLKTAVDNITVQDSGHKHRPEYKCQYIERLKVRGLKGGSTFLYSKACQQRTCSLQQGFKLRTKNQTKRSLCWKGSYENRQTYWVKLPKENMGGAIPESTDQMMSTLTRQQARIKRQRSARHHYSGWRTKVLHTSQDHCYQNMEEVITLHHGIEPALGEELQEEGAEYDDLREGQVQRLWCSVP